MSAAAPPRTLNAAAAVGALQWGLLTLGALVVVTWSFVELSMRLAMSTDPIVADRVLFGSLVGGVAVLVLASIAALLLWRRRASGFIVLGLAWLPAVPLAWLTVASYLDLTVDDRMPGAITLSVVIAAANVALGWILRAPDTAPPPVAH